MATNSVPTPPTLMPDFIDLSITDSVQTVDAQRYDQAEMHRAIIPYAFIRFSNEAITMRASLESILPFCDRGILCYHPQLPGVEEDGSIAIAQEFVERNPGFRLVKYPVPIIPHGNEYLAENLYNGKISRYWLLDCFYNYALLHLKELARENNEYDNAYIFKVDCDHIYCPEALEYARQELWTKRFTQSAVLFSKFDVCFDQSKLIPQPARVQKGLRKLLNMFMIKPQEHVPEYQAHFINHKHGAYDHWLAPLDKLTHFTFTYTYDPDLSRPLEHFSNYERAQFKEDCVFDLDRDLLCSYHLNREKVHAYDKAGSMLAFNAKYGHERKQQKPAQQEQLHRAEYVTCITDYSTLEDIFHKLPVYNGLSDEDREMHAPEVAACPEFWTREHLLEIGRGLNYPYGKELACDPRKYMRTAADYETLINDVNLRIETYLPQFNQQRRSNTDPALNAYYEREARVLNALFHELTKEIERYYPDESFKKKDEIPTVVA